MTPALRVKAVAVALLLAEVPAGMAQSVRPSNFNQTLLAAHSDPVHTVFFPGNLAPAVLTSPTARLRDCDRRSPLLLATGESYALSAAFLETDGRDTTGTPADPWSGLAMVLASAGMRGVTVEIHLEDSIVASLCGDRSALTSFGLNVRNAARASGCPLVTIDSTSSPCAGVVRDHLKQAMQQCTIGCRPDNLESLQLDAAWDYFCVRPEQWPPDQRGQLTLSCARRWAGQRPVIIESRMTMAEHGLFYLGAGAAAVKPAGRRDGQPGVEVSDRNAVLCLGMLVRQMPPGPISLAPQLLGSGILASVSVGESGAYVLLEGGGGHVIRWPGGPGSEQVVPFWYSPGRNQMIAVPSLRAADCFGTKVTPPADELWLYGRIIMNSDTFSLTTVTLAADLKDVVY